MGADLTLSAPELQQLLQQAEVCIPCDAVEVSSGDQ